MPPEPSTRTAGPQRSPTWADRLSLWLLRLAKLRRRAFTREAGEEYAEFYEQFFDEKDLALYDLDRRMVLRGETILNTLRDYAPAGAAILDVGCGLGDVLARMPDGYVLHGTDFARRNVRIAGRRLGGRAHITQASIYELPYSNDVFDVCLCLEVLEHIEDDARAVRELARVLKPGGILIAAVPYTYYWPQYKALMGHFRHYTRQSFSRLMEENGLRTERCLPNYPNWHQTYTRRYALVRAQAMTFGRIFGCTQIHEFRWPWRSEPSLRRLERRLEPLQRRDAQLDYPHQETSTFLLARKTSA